MPEFRLLGPIEVLSAGRKVDAGHPKQRSVLAALLVDVGQDVPVDKIVDRVWGQAPPPSARQSLHVNIARIRRMLEQAGEPGQPPARLLFAADCYRLDLDDALVDLHRFRRTMAQVRDAGCPPDQRMDMLRHAVGLWRGEPLAGLGGEWAQDSRRNWQREYVDAVVAWADAELRIDNPKAVISILRSLVTEHPFEESLPAVLMRALVSDGRPAEALALYDKVRRHLAAELGTDPGPHLKAVHRSILRGEEQQPTPEIRAAETLPADGAAFVGRREHLSTLEMLRTGEPSARAVTCVVSGTAGVGKTALALRWAHSVSRHFPDGRLYANLRGFDPAARVRPAEVARIFLDALGVLPARIPPDADAQVNLYLTLISGKRVLVLLDNAFDADQVRPLLPTTPGSMALVTSRNTLTGLIATDGASVLTVDTMSDAEAHELLHTRLGAGRVQGEPRAVDQIISACAGLPLALAITVARALQSRFRLATLADDLAQENQRLDALDAGDLATQTRAVFSWSYAALSSSAQRMFRSAGLHPGPDISVAAAAALAGYTRPEARRLLAELARMNLVIEQVPGRYTFHDLLRIYANDLAAASESDTDRRAAVVRLLDHYTHTAHAADRAIYPARNPIELPLAPPPGDVRPDQLPDQVEAMSWLRAEYPALPALLRLARSAGQDTRIWQLAWAFNTYVYRQGQWQGRVGIWEAALEAADRLGDAIAQGYAHRGIARAQTQLGAYAEAADHLTHALDLCGRAGDTVGQAVIHYSLGYVREQQGDLPQALRHAESGLALHQSVDELPGQANALNQVGWIHARLGDFARADTHCRQALELHQRTGNNSGQADTWDSLGYVHLHKGDHGEAAVCYREALAAYRGLGDLYGESVALSHLGDTHRAAGDRTAAALAYREALHILDGMGLAGSADLRAKLDRL